MNESIRVSKTNGATLAQQLVNRLRSLVLMMLQIASTPNASHGLPQAHGVERQREDVTATTDRWGWLPTVTLSGALGLLCIAVAFTGARNVTWWNNWTELLFWGGLLVMFVPLATRLLSPNASRTERVGMVVLFGMELYLVKVLRYPVAFAFHDEFLHWRTVNDILATGHLFQNNPILPISPLYPGLEMITVALVHVSGMSVFASAIIILGVARLVLATALYMFYEKISHSSHVAALATVIYLLNPKLIYFDAQFSYESLALSFTVLILYAAVSRRKSEPQNNLGLTITALVSLGAISITHHITAYATAIFLIIWAIVIIVMRRRTQTEGRLSPIGISALGLVLSLAWMVYVASMVVGYLAPHIVGAVEELTKIILGESASRQLFVDHTGQVPPLWERIAGFAGTLLMLFGLPFGLLQVWRRYRNDTAAMMLGVVAMAYPVSLAFRFTEAGGEAADRAAGTIFLALAFVLALGITHRLASSMWTWRWKLPIVAAMSVVFISGVVVGAGPQWSRMPGPFLVSADSRSITPVGIKSAEWARTYLGTNNKIGADRVNRLLMSTYGDQDPTTQSSDKIDISPVFFAPGYGTVQREVVVDTKTRYLEADLRLTTALPRVGIYYEAPEEHALHYTTPMSMESFAKFERLININRLYDSGDIIIYEVGEATSEKSK